MSRKNYIFVDFENIHDVDLSLIAEKPVEVFFVLGQRHKNLPVSLVENLLELRSQVRLIKMESEGKNALDFVLAYHIGRQAVADPTGYFHILSRDKGFDALIQHLQANKILAGRHEELAKIPILQKESPTLAQRVKTLAEHFAHHGTNLPKMEKTLRTHIHARFGKKLSDAELDATIHALKEQEILKIAPTGAVSYKTNSATP